jgi:hypothetical protein
MNSTRHTTLEFDLKENKGQESILLFHPKRDSKYADSPQAFLSLQKYLGKEMKS